MQSLEREQNKATPKCINRTYEAKKNKDTSKCETGGNSCGSTSSVLLTTTEARFYFEKCAYTMSYP